MARKGGFHPSPVIPVFSQSSELKVVSLGLDPVAVRDRAHPLGPVLGVVSFVAP